MYVNVCRRLLAAGSYRAVPVLPPSLPPGQARRLIDRTCAEALIQAQNWIVGAHLLDSINFQSEFASWTSESCVALSNMNYLNMNPFTSSERPSSEISELTKRLSSELSKVPTLKRYDVWVTWWTPETARCGRPVSSQYGLFCASLSGGCCVRVENPTPGGWGPRRPAQSLPPHTGRHYRTGAPCTDTQQN